jgi:hypothetical protein
VSVFFLLLLFFPFLLFAVPCNVSFFCESVPEGFVGMCLGDYDILYSSVYADGYIQFQSTNIACDGGISVPSSSGSLDSFAVASLVSGLDLLSYILISVCVLFSFLFGYSGGRK